MENENLENKIKDLENQLKQKLLERGEEIGDEGQHDNAVADSIDAEIYVLKDMIFRSKQQLLQLKEKNKIKV
jgi:hypothetical protein